MDFKLNLFRIKIISILLSNRKIKILLSFFIKRINQIMGTICYYKNPTNGLIQRAIIVDIKLFRN